jgi:hypothetical protein
MRKPNIFRSYVFYALGHRPPDLHSRCYVPVFDDVHMARKWLDRMVGDRESRFEGDIIYVNVGSFNMTIRSDQMGEVLEAQLAEAPLPDHVIKAILQFKYGTWEEVHTVEDPERVDDGEVKQSPSPKRASKAQRPEGYVTITELCNASGVLPMHARAALRDSGREKPAYGWAFDPREIPAIKKLVGIK